MSEDNAVSKPTAPMQPLPWYRTTWASATAVAAVIAAAVTFLNNAFGLSRSVEEWLGAGDPQLSVTDFALSRDTDCELDPRAVSCNKDQRDFLVAANVESRLYNLTFVIHKKYGVRARECSVQLSADSTRIDFPDGPLAQEFDIAASDTGIIVERRLVRIYTGYIGTQANLRVACRGAISNVASQTLNR